MESEGETVYGTHEDSHQVMSEKVQALANEVYVEFQRMMESYDENVCRRLMPLVVNILEGLDHSFTEKQENEVELELLRDDNEQLLTQYEREKQLRKASEQKYLEVEDSIEEERKQQEGRIEALESGVHKLELKAKNQQDHISRLEDKENEKNKEYNKLHERYTELFKTHMEYMERTKLLMGREILQDPTGPTPKGKGFVLPNLRSVSPGSTPMKSGETPITSPEFIISPGNRSLDSNASLKHELKGKGEKNEKATGEDKQTGTDNVPMQEMSTSTKVTDTDTKQDIPIDDGAISSNKASGDTVNSKQTIVNDKQSNDKQSTSLLNQEQKTEAISPIQIKSTSTPIERLSKLKLDLDTTLKQTENIGHNLLLDGMVEVEEKAAPQTPVSLRDIVSSTPDLEDIDDLSSPLTNLAKRKFTRANESSIYDELNFQDSDALGDMDDGADITGMGKEVENLIMENTELLATKNALNIVKDDLIAKVDELTSEQEMLKEEVSSVQQTKSRLQLRITELEEELKKVKEDLDKKKSAAPAEEEEEVPMAQRKRFTRVEMARVLMERNQYKERLMELQEAVRWTEMIRASKEHPELAKPQDKKKGSIWNFFSNLFRGSEKPPKKPMASLGTVRYNAPTTNLQPVGDPTKTEREKLNLGNKGKAYDFLGEDAASEKLRREREQERRDQYKKVRAIVKKDDGRMQAYGWSLPAKFQASMTKDAQNKSHVPVPVPVYCRPLLDKEPGMKIWCASGVNLTGGKTKDGGNIVGASVFYSDPPPGVDNKDNTSDETDLDKLNNEISEHEKDMKALEENQTISSLVWICTTTSASSRVTVIDANNPADILESFHVTSSHILCISSVPGATESDFISDNDIPNVEKTPPADVSIDPLRDNRDVEEGIGGISVVQCATGAIPDGDTKPMSPVGSPPVSELSDHVKDKISSVTEAIESLSSQQDPEAEKGPEIATGVIHKATGSPVRSRHTTPTPEPDGVNADRHTSRDQNPLVKDGITMSADKELVTEEAEKMSSMLPTMWLGSQSGSLYVHSAVRQWKRCLHSVKLRDSVLHIVHIKGRVFVALADGTVAVFHRDADGQWDLKNYHLLDLGRPHHSIRCMTVVANKTMWCGYRNKIHVVNPKTLALERTFDAHPRKESQVRQLAWVGDGVWVSIRLDSTLRLYHAYTFEHLQDVDIEPYVSKMLGTGKLGFSFVRITSLLVGCNRLWIGTGNGVVISVPLSESAKQHLMPDSKGGKPGGVVRVYSDANSDNITPGSFIPYCSMAQAQLSFHGHKDAVKFFVAVPGAAQKGLSSKVTDGSSSKLAKPEGITNQSRNVLVMSGGEGYVDFRIGDTDDEDEGSSSQGEGEKEKMSISKGDRSHLIVWEVPR
ncbi:unnamed protein product [Owenia fusiformis]|uniref:Uncharacterized protein n=1 Tax=Owenia fusiformis TaxID=6347 RepID=A0A8J1TGQ2_OWEFU|nr:unnamed protein product [Owenia fusiformis]